MRFLSNIKIIRTETDRAVDPMPIETQPPPPKTKQVKKTKVGTKTEKVEDVGNLPSVSHPSHGSTPGQVDHMIASLNDNWYMVVCENDLCLPDSGDDTRPR